MSLVDKLTFESRGARGCSDSNYAFGMTTCCERVGIVDHELDEFYWSSDTPSSSLSLLEGAACPFCGASRWDLHDIVHLDQVPEHWRWACTSEPRPGSRRVRPLSEHVRELLAFCERVAGPVPPFDTTLFLEMNGTAARIDAGWRVARDALFTTTEFAPRFDRLLLAGYAWVNLSAYGIWQEALVIGVERPREATGVPAGLTSVNYSGPPHTPEASARWSLNLDVVPS